jgi:hypothetical protein
MVYFCTTNVISLIISYLVNNDGVKKVLGIPILTPHQLREIKESQKNTKGMFDAFKDWKTNSKALAEINNREDFRRKQFERAGTGLPPKTFKTNPKDDLANKKK